MAALLPYCSSEGALPPADVRFLAGHFLGMVVTRGGEDRGDIDMDWEEVVEGGLVGLSGCLDIDSDAAGKALVSSARFARLINLLSDR